MSRRKSGRRLSGVILLDKPTGISSNAALQRVRRFFNANKAGHTGALDPLATGMLPVCLGEATKFSHYLLNADKAYRVTARLGVRTTTSDSEGEVVSTQNVTQTLAEIQALLPEFVGEQEQSPSMYSALKYEGRPLYYYARNGIEVPRKTRTIEIRSIELISYSDHDLVLDVVCSKGTYIRTLVDDFGQRLGCGAHVTALHRHWVAGLQDHQMVTIDALEALMPARTAQGASEDDADYKAMDAYLLPCDSIIEGVPKFFIGAADVTRFQHGLNLSIEATDAQALMAAQIESAAEDAPECRVVAAESNLFLGIATLQSNTATPQQWWLAPKRVLNVGERSNLD